MTRQDKSPSMFDAAILKPAVVESFRKLDPRELVKNPVMFTVEMVALVATVIMVRDIIGGAPHIGFEIQIVAWLWVTVLFATFAEAVAEGRGKAQADTLRRMRSETMAKLLLGVDDMFEPVRAHTLKVGDKVLVEAGDLVPGDGEIYEGVATIDESAITGESAPVIREAGGDRSAVTGGTKVLSDRIKVRITAEQGSSFLDRMIALVEGASRAKTPNELALSVLLAAFTHHLRAGRRHHPELRRLCRRRGLGGRADRALRHPDPDHDRRAPVGDRHRRHEPAGALQRARHCRAAPSRRRATSTRCCSTRPARSRWATGMPPSSSPSPAWPRTTSRARPSSPAWRTRRRRAARSSCWPRRNTACAASRWPSATPSSFPSRRRRA